MLLHPLSKDRLQLAAFRNCADGLHLVLGQDLNSNPVVLPTGFGCRPVTLLRSTVIAHAAFDQHVFPAIFEYCSLLLNLNEEKLQEDTIFMLYFNKLISNYIHALRERNLKLNRKL